MKNLLLTFNFIITLTLAAKAQLEITSNPLGHPIGIYTLSVDYNVTENWGLGAEGLLIDTENNIFYLNTRYYFSPSELGNNNFYLGMYVGQINYETFSFIGNGTPKMTFGLGGILGYKFVIYEHFVIDLALGAGRGIDDSGFLPYLKTNVGYRF